MSVQKFQHRLTESFGAKHGSWNRRSGLRYRHHSLPESTIQRLEDRALLAAVSWNGNAGDFQWNTAANWSGNVVPGAADDVTIDVPGNITVVLATTNKTVRSIFSEESLTLASGSLKVTAASEVRGTFISGTNTTLTAEGARAVFRATGPTTVGISNLSASNGGTIDLPNATSYAAATDGDVNLLANGSGSQLLLTGITSLAGVGRNGRVAIRATNGGLVDLSGVVTIPSGTTEISAKDAGSLVDVSNLQTWTGPSTRATAQTIRKS